MAAQGFNTAHGFDIGPPPPGLGFAGYYQQPFQGYYAPPPFVPQPMMPMPYSMGYPNFAFTAPVPPDCSYPGLFLKNETGGRGYPDYCYLYPQEHCKIHVFKTKEKPWHITAYTQDTSNHIKIIVPVTMTIKELMQNLGLKNDDANKNVMYECSEKGNGKWTHGLKFLGGDKDKVKKTIADYGWNKKRSGHPGQLPVVWIWVTDQGV